MRAMAVADRGSVQPKRFASGAELDDLQAHIDSVRSRLLKPTGTKPMSGTPVWEPRSVLVLKRRRSWALAPLAMAMIEVGLAEVAVFALTGHGFVNNVGLILLLVWLPWMTQSGELRVRQDGIVIPNSGGVVYWPGRTWSA